MHGVRNSHPNLAGIVPYDPKYLPAKQYLSANENPSNVPEQVQLEIRKALKGFPFNRYPDPLGNELRDLIAEANGLSRENVLLGNGGDELLFNLALTWGGPGRTSLERTAHLFGVRSQCAPYGHQGGEHSAQGKLRYRRRGRACPYGRRRHRLCRYHQPQ